MPIELWKSWVYGEIIESNGNVNDKMSWIFVSRYYMSCVLFVRNVEIANLSTGKFMRLRWSVYFEKLT